MFVVTNRELIPGEKGLKQFGKRANPEGPNELRMVEITGSAARPKVEIIPDVLDAAWQARAGIDATWLSDMGFDPAQPVYGSAYVASQVLGRVNPRRAGGRGRGRNLLLFVHGYNNDMGDVVARAMGFETHFGVEVMAFSWPANGGGVAGAASYLSDKNDARVSVGALDRTLAKVDDMLRRFNGAWARDLAARALARHPDNVESRRALETELVDRGCPFNVSLLLHSMGNYLYKQLMFSSTAQSKGLSYENVILAAADTNNAEHALWVNQIPARRRIFVTINENDAALRASRLKLGREQQARLGHYLFDLDATRALYVDFTSAPHVGSSHAYFEGDALKNASVKKFFNAAVNGEDAESGLRFDPATNTYRHRR